MKKCIIALIVMVVTTTAAFAQIPGPKTAMPTNAPAAAETAKKATTPAPPMADAQAPEMQAHAATTHVKKAKHSTMGAGSSKMTYKCPMGDALCDAAGKCPKCGMEMVAISGEKQKILRKRKVVAPAMEMKKEEMKKG